MCYQMRQTELGLFYMYSRESLIINFYPVQCTRIAHCKCCIDDHIKALENVYFCVFEMRLIFFTFIFTCIRILQRTFYTFYRKLSCRAPKFSILFLLEFRWVWGASPIDIRSLDMCGRSPHVHVYVFRAQASLNLPTPLKQKWKLVR